MNIKWNKTAIKQLFEIIQFIEEKQFEEYAKKFETEILNKIRLLPKSYIYQAFDKYKINNDGTFRAFEYDRYRISFRVKNSEIRILHIRHTSRLPRTY